MCLQLMGGSPEGSSLHGHLNSVFIYVENVSLKKKDYPGKLDKLSKRDEC